MPDILIRPDPDPIYEPLPPPFVNPCVPCPSPGPKRQVHQPLPPGELPPTFDNAEIAKRAGGARSSIARPSAIASPCSRYPSG